MHSLMHIYSEVKPTVLIGTYSQVNVHRIVALINLERTEKTPICVFSESTFLLFPYQGKCSFEGNEFPELAPSVSKGKEEELLPPMYVIKFTAK